VTSIDGQLVNSRAPDIAIYLRTYLRVALVFIATAQTVYASMFGSGPPGTNSHSCNQTCLDSGDSQ